MSKAAIIAIVEEQTNAAELDSPDPKIQKKKNEPDLTSMKVRITSLSWYE